MPNAQDLMQIGQKVVDMNNQGQYDELFAELFTPDAVSAEAAAMPGKESNEDHGMEAIIAKGEWWFSNNEIHEFNAEGPFVHGTDRFCVIFDMDTTNKQSGERAKMREVATYYVNDAGKIYREEFAYPLG